MSVVLTFQIVTIATWILALIVVCLRYTARRFSKAGFWYDDWLLIPATLFAAGLCFISAIWMTKQGVLQHSGPLTEKQAWDFNRTVILADICWAIVIWLVKSSILAFYWRLFSAKAQSIRVIIWSLAVFITCWFVTVVLLKLLCGPLVLDKCYIPSRWLFVGCTIPHVITDVVLVGFPVPLIYKLHIRRPHKVSLIAVFMVSGFVTICSIIRLLYLYKGYSSTFVTEIDYIDIFIWTNVEANVSLICSCLPCLRPVLSLISDKLNLLRQRASSHKRGVELLMDMLPAGRSALRPILPSSNEQTQTDEQRPVLYSTIVAEAPTRNPRMPEVEADAPGPHILEAETVETILEMYSQIHVAELEGRNDYAAEL